jgi:hypothetical protein
MRAKLRISLHTARDHLKIVFAKTGTSRQSQLVALLTRTVAAFGDMECVVYAIGTGKRPA